MGMQKEREAFDEWYGVKPKGWFEAVRYNTALKAWQAAKAQAVPDGFVLVPVTPSDEFIDKLADVICDEFCTTISGSAHCAAQAYKLIVEA